MDGKRQRQLTSSVSQILFEQDKKRSQQRKIGTYTTRFFHMCPGAQQIFPEIEEEIGGKDAAMLARMADQIFSIEEKVLAAGEPNEEATSAARKIYSELMSGAKRLGVDDKLDFMQGHIDIIEKGSRDEEDERKPGMGSGMRGFGTYAGVMDGALDDGTVGDGGMGNGGAMGESYLMEKMDPVGKEDKDVDNDGDVDDSDEYLMKRRKAIGKAMAKRKGKKSVEERKSQILGTLLSEEEGDKEDMEKVVDELKGASKTHLGQSKRLSKYLKGDKKKVNEDMDAQADFHQHLDDSGVLLAKDHKEHGIKQMELGYEDKIAYSFSSDKHPGISDPHTFHDVENEGVSAVGFLPKGGLNLDPQKVRVDQMFNRDHEDVIDTHGIEDYDAKHRYGYKAESYTPKDLREATMSRIKSITSNSIHNSDSTVADRIKGML
jgi:hypothetical protein